MNDDKFKVINGTKKNIKDLVEPIKIERADAGQKVMSIQPLALKTSMSERRLRKIVEVSRRNPNIEILYDKYAEEEKERNEKIDELQEMFKDNGKVIVLDPRNQKK